MTATSKIFALICLLGVSGAAMAAKAPDEAGVRDAENRWNEAFVSGDAVVLDALLDADYVSVNASGKARPKAEIIQGAKKYGTAHPGEHGNPLPPTSTIRVVGNAAVVQHHGTTETSVDVFYFRDGQWHAWYSQHTKLEG